MISFFFHRDTLFFFKDKIFNSLRKDILIDFITNYKEPIILGKRSSLYSFSGLIKKIEHLLPEENNETMEILRAEIIKRFQLKDNSLIENENNLIKWWVHLGKREMLNLINEWGESFDELLNKK
ncbi:MAG: hypothetical protein ACTSYC_08025 [Promethearchaeota archaeon]